MTTTLHPQYSDAFEHRHIGPSEEDCSQMLSHVGVKSLDELIDNAIPKSIQLNTPPELRPALTEQQVLTKMRAHACKNKVFKSYIGLGYYPCHVPSVIQRNIFENPGWYTQYTPYQAEISQGRLEALLNFQTLVADLTGLPVANASLLDEATAAAEAMLLLYNASKRHKGAHHFFVSDRCFPATLDVLKGRAEGLGITLVIGNSETSQLDETFFGLLHQFPDLNGRAAYPEPLIKQAKGLDISVAVAVDLMSLVLFRPPADVDVVIGSTQRFGVPLGYGGPHAAFITTTAAFQRKLPGRIIGVSKDVFNQKAYRMALQTREQHIRREKATSNICTAQALLAIMASMYALYHGPKGVTHIATRIHQLAVTLEKTLCDLGFQQVNDTYFDTLTFHPGAHAQDVIQTIHDIAQKKRLNFRYNASTSISISVDETTERDDIDAIVSCFSEAIRSSSTPVIQQVLTTKIPDHLKRKAPILTHPIFSTYHSETQMMRYIKRLETKDLSLTTAMIPLGSCTMKLNAATELMPLSWPEFSNLHPFCPISQATGYQDIIKELESDLAALTGFEAVSLQPNSGAQGEYAGLKVIDAYHKDHGNAHRNVVLLPSSAHGTNPASAAIAGFTIVVIKCNPETGDIDFQDLKEKVIKYKETLSALMITYPSTHGVFEDNVQDICTLIHDHGGLIYLDGANLNAQIGLTNPKIIGADVCHINLHKTFSIPHGGGGPGMGPICVTKALSAYLPGHIDVDLGHEKAIHAVSAAPWGSASILLISYIYIKMMGSDGLKKASQIAILNANYMKSRLEHHYPIVYTNKNNCVAHEFIVDFRAFKHSAHIDIEDVAKRLMDFGFHAPTMAWPVPGTLMIEPTESEDKAELDRFCSALITIKEEIQDIAEGRSDKKDNPLKNAPHTVTEITQDDWEHPYTRKTAAFPDGNRTQKYWPPVGRINNAFGDRHLVCTCPPLDVYEEKVPLNLPV